jgi:hypothetical protein
VVFSIQDTQAYNEGAFGHHAIDDHITKVLRAHKEACTSFNIRECATWPALLSTAKSHDLVLCLAKARAEKSPVERDMQFEHADRIADTPEDRPTIGTH